MSTNDQAEQNAAKFAVILKQVAQEMDLEIVHPDNPMKIYALFPKTETWEKLQDYHKRAGDRIRELQEKQA